ncbi:hypothetical protein CK203_019329 [Vitis vinifera]|uniref:Uncharacterized protein n=1 Tax=Vitis vinifera TaxID=29760 RepID=A0A438J7S8_VITVI|nr:hypothetical protein CK203_019329 [Vitis vinifera]
MDRNMSWPQGWVSAAPRPWFMCALLGGMAIIDRSGETLWKMNNSGLLIPYA